MLHIYMSTRFGISKTHFVKNNNEVNLQADSLS